MDARAFYDCIIVGAGISGLYTALQLQKKYPSWTIALCEKYKGMGGRTYSYHPPGFPGVGWEMGAGRIHDSHRLVHGLLKEYGLTTIPISSAISWWDGGVAQENPFESRIVPVYFAPLTHLDAETLANDTLGTLLTKVYGPTVAKSMTDYFPYWAEIHVMRADLALRTFVGGEMSSHHGYSVVKEGFSALIARMRTRFEKRGGFVLPRHSLVRVTPQTDGTVDLKFLFGKPSEKPNGRITLKATHKCILALHCDALSQIGGLRMPMLRHVRAVPLFRIYAIFPTPAWFEPMARIVMRERPRYIIPIDPKKGVIMISYTEGADSEAYGAVYKKGGDTALQKVVMKDIRAVFGADIPDPLFFRGHHWDTGTTYWLPGSYDPAIVSQQSLNPMPGVYVTGESFSLRQSWVEGALEQSDQLLRCL